VHRVVRDGDALDERARRREQQLGAPRDVKSGGRAGIQRKQCAMRAAAQNRDVAMLMGINPNRVFAVATGVSLALAGAAGSLLMPFYPASPMAGQVFVLMAFVAVVLGTLGNVKGALIASLMMGVAESLGIQFVGADSGLIVVFLMLLLTLAFRPSGLAGGGAR